MIKNINKYPPWNNEPAPFGSLIAIFWGKYFWEHTKKKFLRGKKFVFLKKKLKKKFGKKIFWIFFLDFFNIIVPYFDSNRFFQTKSLSYHIKLFLGLLLV